MRFLSLCVALLCSLCCCNAYQFLMVLNSPGRSHFNVGHALAKGLVQAGHEITVVSVFPQKKPLPGYHDINVPNIISAMKGDLAALWQSIQKPLTQKLIDHYDMGFRLTRALFVDPNFQELLQSNRTFDAVICETFYNDAHYGLAEHFNAPLIGLSTGGGLTFITDMVGSPAPASFVPHIMLPFNDHMSLHERLLNVAFLAYERLLLDYYYLPGQQALYKEFFPHNKRCFYEMRRNASLVLINQHVSLSFPRPYAPNMIEVGGMHIDGKLSPLPAKIERFLNESEHGAIYFSMGSNLKSKDLPAEKVQEILRAFRGLKQRVLWKFEDTELPNKPDNLFISDWFPQTDILAHPQVLAFVTHGGMLSTTESIYHGKPVIGLPIFSDQFFNMAHAEQTGYGIMLDFKSLNAADLKAAIERIASVPSYTEVVRGMSFRYRDQQQTPLQNAVYWVEHVTRHQGAAYLQSAAQRLNWWQYHNVDVLLIIFGLLLLLLVGLPFALWRLLRAVLSAGHRQQPQGAKIKRN
ncbi:UDP-glucuronosyltransferase 1-9 [Drosophila guanche]|uniref:UDP-glucuronosyltransferase n=1 Tax=Drosophila guanche TaxID=7266 RepID=A0A3B0JMK9_DROGU|nr:UDP-glucuronosyltransferase 1-9 [Drosophila guanche]SPP83487.1 blast:UDP-glucuronosyltransferase 2B15 [Drosophila guanche]